MLMGPRIGPAQGSCPPTVPFSLFQTMPCTTTAINLYTGVTYPHTRNPTSCAGLDLPPGQEMILPTSEIIPLMILSPFAPLPGTDMVTLAFPSWHRILVWTRHAVSLARRLFLIISVQRVTDYRKQASVIQDFNYCFIKMISGNTV